jgi:mono/diheme cytochrome c family protein
MIRRTSESAAMLWRNLLTRATLAWWAAVILLSPGAAHAQSNPAREQQPPATQLARGSELFDNYCAQCHRADGTGGIAFGSTTSSNLADRHQWRHGATDADLIRNIREGVGPSFTMPPWGSQIKGVDLYALVAFIKSLNTRDGDRP